MSDNVFNKFSRRAVEKESLKEVAAETAARPLYEAIGKNRTNERQTRFRVHYPNGIVELLSYAYLVEAITTSPQYVSLIFTNCVVTLRGENLSDLIMMLQEEKVVSIQGFNGQRFAEPAAGIPLIREITRQSLDEFRAAEPKANLAVVGR